MEITRNQFLTAQKLKHSRISQGAPALTIPFLAEALEVPRWHARKIAFLLENEHLFVLPKAEIIPTERELFLTDIHFPDQDVAGVEAALEYGHTINPSLIWLNGDIIDLHRISRYTKNPTAPRVDQEMAQVKEFLKRLREEFPKARICYLKGNHEVRWESMVCEKVPDIYEVLEGLLPRKLGLPELNIEWLEEPTQVGKLWHLHGHEKPGGSYSPENIPNVMWKYIHDNFICGHFHRNQRKTFNSISGKKFAGIAVGYLAGPMSYAPLHQWTQGLCDIQYDSRGHFSAELREIQDGRVL